MTTKSVAWNTGKGNITLTYQGQGDGTITVESDANTIGSLRSQTITVETVGGAITRNLIVSQAACPFPVGDVKNYAYTGSYQTVELPAGQYKLQCWGAQGGSNGTNSTYGITAQAGGKGGYSEGIITLSQKTTMRVYVGGQGSATAGGFNGGGSTTGTSQKDTGSIFGYSKMGGGGGATDIRLSSGGLYSRMIVAGGGSGGAMCFKRVTSSSSTKYLASNLTFSGMAEGPNGKWISSTAWDACLLQIPSSWRGGTLTYVSSYSRCFVSYSTSAYPPSVGDNLVQDYLAIGSGTKTATIPSNATYFIIRGHRDGADERPTSLTISYNTTSTSTKATPGRVGGGVQGGNVDPSYAGKQNSAGLNGSFGQGANQTTSDRCFVSAAGGGGWYGGGNNAGSNANINEPNAIGGGSGFVNTAESAGNRPSGYTGLQLDSGTTYNGATSFPSTSGGNETGHSGNGYARITRLS